MRSVSKALLLVSSAAAALLMGACSVSGAFSKSASPIAERVATDFDRYNASEADTSKKASNTALVGTFREAVAVGDIEKTATTWFGPTKLRDTYTGYLGSDPRFSQPGGAILLQGKRDMLSDFDLIVATGRKAAGSPPTPSPPR